ncbi:Bug family tripartite tricarboxylate transporter substrate binding protein [Alcaligenes sp. SDU_A2]|uniref:Bug family tripartite tricarboxylate transporter substrate binding protein n=1 Tax=Alcaligenes sp. SDU_A2 TaxID=3136634 RepID=UPI00311EF616
MWATASRVAIGLLVLCGTPGLALAASINLVLPFPPAGAVDQLARDLTPSLVQSLSEPVVVVNKPGAGGMVAIQATLAERPGERNYLIAHTGLLSLNPYLFRQPAQRQATERLQPVALLAQAPLLLLVRADSGIKTLDDLRALGKQRRLRFGSAGIGTVAHLAGAQLAQNLGVQADHIPYRGAAAALTDLAGGEVDFIFDLLVGSGPLIADGRVLPVAVAADRRLEQAEQIPTLTELGQPLRFSSWWGVVAPRQTPAADLTAMQSALVKAMDQAQMRARLLSKGMIVDVRTGAAFEQFIAAESRKYEPLIRRLDIRLD